ncbi:MAG: 16S rRNA (cytosine(967)-C(5))-methyltransferase RsmB [Acidobacteriota bacterium]
MITVRAAAAQVLLAIETGETTLGTEVERWRSEVPERDRALFLELATGTLRWRNELDAVIAAASQRAAREIDPPALAVLRLAVYQLRHLDRIPEHAIVHESVDTIRQLGQPKLSGFVNAVLRTMIRRGPAISLPKRPPSTSGIDAQVRYLSITLSHPAWLVHRWIARVGFDAAEAWCQFNNSSPTVTVRSAGRLDAQTLLARLADVSIEATAAPFVPDAIRLPPGSLGRVPADLRDELVVQDEGAQLVARLADARPGERVLDACASPGGKSLVIASDLKRGDSPTRLVAADFRQTRVETLARTLRPLAPDVSIVRLDARVALPFSAAFDCVLLDAPCSGLGTVRRDPDLKWTRRAADLPRFAADQLAMLRACAAVVRPGGRVIYATCSSEPEENTAVVDAFLADASEFTLMPPDPASPVPAVLRNPAGALETRPYEQGLDAYFGSVLARRRTA